MMLVVLYLPKGIYRFVLDMAAKGKRLTAGSEVALKEN